MHTEPRITPAADLWEPVRFDRELVGRYDRPGPRYTSYPTAPHFREGFTEGEYRSLLAASAATRSPLSVYVHVPFCERRCYFCGCNVVIARDRERGRRYLAFLEREMELIAGELGAPDRELVQIHWGGGTPTFLPPEDLEMLGAILRRHFRISDACEFGVEADPRELSSEQLDVLAGLGVNRLSLGVQDLDPQVQAAVNRVQSLELTRAAIEGARRRGIASINVDLIYGLPFQTPQGFAATVEEVLRLVPDRLAVFSFAYLPQRFRHQRALTPTALPAAETKLSILEQTVHRLTAAGYVFVGMDHFARPTDPLAKALRDRSMTRNFQGYSTHLQADLVGFGVSAIGQLAGAYAQNRRSLPEYEAALERGRLPVVRGLRPRAEDRLRRDVIMALLCDFRIDKAAIEAAHGIEFDRHFAAELSALEGAADDGLVNVEREAVEVTPLGRLLVRNLAMVFDEYLGRESGVAYSRTV